MEEKSTFRKIFSVINRICCALLFAFFIFGLAMEISDRGKYDIRFIKCGIGLSAYVLRDIFIYLLILFAGLIFLRGALGSKAPDKFRYSSIIISLAVCFAAYLGFDALEDYHTDSFTRLYYLPESTETILKSTSSTAETRIGSQEKVEIYCTEEFLSGGFQADSNYEIQLDETLGDKVEIIVEYKGADCEMARNYYSTEEYSYYDYDEISLYLYPEDYHDYEIKADIYAKYYAQGIDLSFADNYAVSKIIVKTAYPDRIKIAD